MKGSNITNTTRFTLTWRAERKNVIFRKRGTRSTRAVSKAGNKGWLRKTNGEVRTKKIQFREKLI